MPYGIFKSTCFNLLAKEQIMKPVTLVADGQYEGQYVALKSFQDNTVVAYGIEPVEVLAVAEAKGFSDPVVMFIPKSNMTHVY